MNRRQKAALWCGVAVIVLMGLYPPWVTTRVAVSGEITAVTNPVGHWFIWDGPPRGIKLNEAVYGWGPRVDLSRLCIQWAIVAIVAGAAIATSADKKNS